MPPSWQTHDAEAGFASPELSLLIHWEGNSLGNLKSCKSGQITLKLKLRWFFLKKINGQLLLFLQFQL